MIQFGGQTPLKLARAIEARRLPHPRHAVRRRRPRRGPRALRRAARRARHPLPGVGDRRERRARRSTSPSGSATRCSSGRRTCSAAARCASATTPTRCATRSPASRARRSSTASSRTRSRSTSTRSATAPTPTSAAVMQHVEEAGVHSGDSACVLPAQSLDVVGDRGDPRDRQAPRAGARRRRRCSTCSSRSPTTRCSCSR